MINLYGDLWVVSGSKLTHPWDASAYLILGPEPVLIDCGSTLGYEALKASLATKGIKPEDIRHVFATHCHWDHVSAMAQLRRESNARFYIHARDKRAVETGNNDLTSAFLYGQNFEPFKVDATLRDGQVFRFGDTKLEVLHTPGHTPGSCCFVVESKDRMRVLIAGDCLWGGFHPKVRSNLVHWQRSLERLSTLKVAAVTWGHIEPRLYFDAHRRLNEALRQFGVYHNPWFKPFDQKFRY